MSCLMRFIFSILFTFIILPSNIFGQLKYLKNDTTVPEHPRILLFKNEEKSLQQAIEKESRWKKVHQLMLAECDSMLQLPVLERTQIGRRLLSTSRECIRRVFFLSYAWRMTHDTRYLQRAENELLTVSNFSDWNPSHFLDVAEMTLGVAIGYDWLHKDLSQNTKKIVKEAIITKGLQASLDAKYNGWLKATHNWNQVCNAGITYGALAVYEDNPELAKQIIDRAIESIKLPMEDYKPDGAYPEGYGYWDYGTSFNVLFISAIEKTFGNNFGLMDNDGFLKTASYITNMTGPTKKNFNYSDNGDGSGLHPAMFWLANYIKNPSLLYNENNYLAVIPKSMANNRLLPAIMIWGAGMNLDAISPPKDLIWVGQGKNPVALMRTSWADSNSIFVGMKGGSPSVNHGHMDIGSFVMDAQGERWSMDFGMQQYESLESKGVDLWNMKQNSQRWQILRYNNFSHSTLTFNNELQDVAGFAPITNVTNSPSFLSATTDLSAVYKTEAKSVKRGIAIVDKQYVMIRDEIQTNDKETTIRWVMLTPATVKIVKNGIAELTQNNKKLQLQVIEPANITLTTWSTEPKQDFDAPNPGTILVGFEAKIPANPQTSFTVLLIPQGAIVKKEKRIEPLNKWSKRK